ncbi:hypothetical protein ACHQM5_001654 [Ranunculus cassubicifolius]
MSGGGGKVRASSTTTRVSMPKKIQDMICTIKEIAGAHTDEDIHAMLKECSMDPNEAAQKLLVQRFCLEISLHTLYRHFVKHVMCIQIGY